MSLGSGSITETTIEETEHYQLTRGILEFPDKYWRHLLEEPKDHGDAD